MSLRWIHRGEVHLADGTDKIWRLRPAGGRWIVESRPDVPDVEISEWSQATPGDFATMSAAKKFVNEEES